MVSVAGCVHSGENEDVVAGLIAAHNRYDVAAAVEFVTDDVRLSDPYVQDVTGREGFRARMQWDSSLATQWIAPNPLVRGDSVVLHGFAETSSWHQALGVGLLVHVEARFILRGPQIARIEIGPADSSSRARLGERMADFLAWAQHEFPARLARLQTDGRLMPNPRRAADWLDLLRQWADTLP